jgi:hypothetical protein
MIFGDIFQNHLAARLPSGKQHSTAHTLAAAAAAPLKN